LASSNASISTLRRSLEHAILTKTLQPKEGLADLEHRLNVEFRRLNAEAKKKGRIAASKPSKPNKTSSNRITQSTSTTSLSKKSK
jgi:hypothetical protein